MALPVTTPEGSTLRLFYAGPVGVAGVGVAVAFDITSLPLSVRQDPTFEDNFRIFLRSSAAGITNVSNNLAFTYVDNLPTELIVTLDSDNANNAIDIEIWYLQSAIR